MNKFEILEWYNKSDCAITLSHNNQTKKYVGVASYGSETYVVTYPCKYDVWKKNR